MVNLISLPASYFNIPQIDNCIIKHLLKKNDIDSKHYDICNTFLLKCITSNYISNKYKLYYDNLDKEEKAIISNTDQTKFELMHKNETLLSVNVKENLNFQKIIDFISHCNNIEWTSRNIFYKTKIETIDNLIDFCMSSELELFDDAFSENLLNFKNGDTFYFAVKYAYQMPIALRFIRKIKSTLNNSFIIIGGDYITQIKDNINDLLVKYKDIDIVTLYGNYYNVLNIIKGKKSFDYFYRANDGILYNKGMPRLSDLDFVPSFDDLDLNNYLSNLKIVPFYLNYGCFHSKCTFCNRYIYYKGYHTLNINKIFSQIKHLSDDGEINGIYFVDECVPEHIITSFANFVLKNRINVKWIIETRFQNDYLNKALINKYYESGLREISFGLESLSNRILNLMNKNIKIRSAKKILKYFFKCGIFTCVTLMHSFPSEGKKDLKKSLKFLNRFKYVDSFGFSEFKLLRNSIICNNLHLNYSKNLNLMFATKRNCNESVLLNAFYNSKKIHNFLKIRNNVLYRTQYMFANRASHSLNFFEKTRQLNVT